jgi:carboxylesterase
MEKQEDVMDKGHCVLVHGFTGSPEEVEPLAKALRDAGYSVSLPTLYGHGESKEELRNATTTAWIQSVEPIVVKQVALGSVHLVGFSMGAMVCAVLAARYPVASITMLSPAVFYVGPKQMFRQIAGVIKESWAGRDLGAAYLRKRIDKMSNTPLSSIKQFRRMVQIGKAALPKVTAPLCVIQGEQDEVVEPRGAAYVCTHAASAHKELHYLPQSTHMVCHGAECESVNRLVLSFLQRLAENDASQHSPRD